MKAVVQYALAPGSVALRDVPVPEPAPGEVVLEVKAVAVCGSDLHQRAGRQSWPVNVPVILGHEFCGVVAAVGVGVDEFAVGDRVASETAAIICGRCLQCRSGRYELCRLRKGFGYGTNGAMAESVCVPQRVLHRLGDKIPFEAAALAEPACVAYNSVVVRGGCRLGDVVVVLGPGPIGLLCAMMAKLNGASCVLVGLSSDCRRFELAKQLGIPHTAAIDTDDVSALVDECTGGNGADLVIDAAGVSASLKDAIDVVKPGGTVVKVGWGPEPLGYSMDPLIQKAADIRGSFSHNFAIWDRVLRMMDAGLLDVTPLISGTYPMKEWAEAFEAMEDGRNVKSVITPNYSE